MLKLIRGYVTHITEYQESSKIMQVMCEDGIYSVIAKGCKNIKSPLRLVSQKLIYAEFVIYYKEKGISTIKEGTVLNNFENIKKDLLAFSYFSYLTELTMQVMKQHNNVKIFELFDTAVNKINNGLNPKVITNILEVKFLDFLGVPMNLTECVRCGSKTNIITIDPDEGGIICQDCYTNEFIYDIKVIKMLRNYYLIDLKSISELKISNELIDNINRIINIYYDRYTGLYMHSKKFLENIDSLNLK